MTLPKGYKRPDENSSTENPTKRAAGKLGISLIIAAVLVAFIVATATKQWQIYDNVVKAEEELERTADELLTNCIRTLPYGTVDCDFAINTLVDACNENNQKFDYCRDSRIDRYMATVLAHNQ